MASETEEYYLRLDDFDYDLPPEQIASHPLPERDASRLLILDRNGTGFKFSVFSQLPGLLRPGSVLVLNDTQVIPARLAARKPTGGAVELLLVRRLVDAEITAEGSDAALEKAAATPATFREVWEVMGKGLGPRAEGMELSISPEVRARVLLAGTQGSYKLAIEGHGHESLLHAAETLGRIPLPPYIEAQRRRATEASGGLSSRDTTVPNDEQRYQTVYARVPGAVAAPTAGLHFTPEVLAEVRARGHEIVFLTLHVGPGTFRPVKEDDPSRHRMEEEHYVLPAATADAVSRARAEGRPVVAVGTTVVRTLEGAFRQGFQPGPGRTDVFIKPGDSFNVVTDLITNFHLPKSTLLMLVSAFAGRDHVLAAYKAAVEAKLRFYSYGDAMFISPGQV